MLDVFFEVAYTESAAKVANAKVLEKMRGMPVELLNKLASGEKVAWSGDIKACGSGDSGGPVSWLDQFKNTPLFDKALALERADLQLEQEDIKQRQSQMGQEIWVKRDALRLQRRLLELDLVLEGEGEGPAAGAEQTEEKGVELLEQAQAEERAAGEGEEPHEKKEDAAIQQFQEAQAEEAAAKPKAPEKKPLVQVDSKEAQAKIAAAEASGRMLAKVASFDLSNGEKLTTALGALAGANKGSKSDQPGTGAVLGGIGALGGASLGSGVGRMLHGHPAAGMAGGVLGGVAGYKALTHHLGKKKEAADLTQSAREEIKPSNFADPKGNGPGDTGKYPIEDKSHAKAALGLVGMHGSDAEKSKVRAAVAKKYPGLESKTAGIIGSALTAGKAMLPQVAGAAKGLGSLASTAYNAGGVGQVAKSLGSVAGGFAKANPLAAAGIAAGTAGAAGLAAGRLSKPNQPQLVRA